MKFCANCFKTESKKFCSSKFSWKKFSEDNNNAFNVNVKRRRFHTRIRKKLNIDKDYYNKRAKPDVLMIISLAV